ncbi:MAG: SH3 domain-containing protein [Gemmatimonadaceae bacterium]
MRPIRSLLIFLCAAPLAAPLSAQSALVADASVRSTPGGSVVAVLKQGTTVTAGVARNGYVYVTFTGWMDGANLGPARDSFPAHLTGKIAMRLRSAPSMRGAILGEVRPLAGVFTTGKQASWVNVHRSGWVDAKTLPAAVTSRAATPTTKAPAKAAPSARVPAAKPVATKAAPSANTKAAPAAAKNAPAKSAPPPKADVAPAADTVPEIELLPEGTLRVTRTTVGRNAPNGLIVGQIGAGSYVVPLARSRGWVRVRSEVWVPERDVVPADATYGAALSAADLRADPEGTRGKTVRWEVQVLALQYADPLRRDLAKDEPYFLAKGPGAEDQLLYLAIPPSLLAEARSTQALTRLLVTARVRTGRSQPVGIPILDILSFARQ